MIRHLRNYASAGVLSALVGVVSFPILTRNLSVEEYGILGLIASSIALFTAIGKLGMQHAVIRFFAQVHHGNSVFSGRQLNTTVLLVFGVLALLTMILWLVTGYQLLPGVLQYENIEPLFLITAGAVFLRLLVSCMLNFFRAQQRSREVATSQVIPRVVNLVFILTLLMVTDIDPYRLLACLVLSELVGFVYAAWHFRHDFEFSLKAVSVPLGQAMLVYGLPLMLLESLGLVLRLSDRYLIEALLGVTELGQYSASYNLVAYLDVILLGALVQAVKPAYMQIWEAEGAPPTRRFLAEGFHLYLVIGIPFLALFSITSPHLLTFLAGAKYAPGTVIIPFVAFSFLLEGAMYFLAAGLYIRKDTKVLMKWGLIATAVNLGFNVLLIPRFGIAGAAAVTILSYAVFMGGVARQSFQYVDFDLQWRPGLIVALISALICVGLEQMDLGNELMNFFAIGLAGLVLLVPAVYLIDKPVRALVDGWLARRTRPGAVL